MTQERFRPSEATYWGNCAAFQRFTCDMPETTNDAAREGTCAAWVAEVVLNSSEGIACDDLVGKVHANGWEVTDEMAQDVQEYVNIVRSYGGTITAEEHIVASESPLIAGTLDSSITVFQSGILRVPDLKYGRRVVETTTKQLVCYAYGKLMTLPAGSVKEIHLSIYQPRAFHRDGIYRTRVVTPEQLHQEFLELWNMAVEGQKPDSLATPGPHCADCSAAAGCEALAQTSYNLVNTIQSRSHRKMTNVEIARELDFVEKSRKTVNAYCKAIESEAEARAKIESIPGWSVAPTFGNRVFTVPPVTLQLLTGVDPWVKKVCTPIELERRGASTAQVAKLTTKATTGMKLTRVTPDDIASMFNATKGK